MTTSTEIIAGEGRILSLAFEWKIDNYSSYSNFETGKCLRSPSFDAQCNLWYLKLYPNGQTKEYQGSVSLYLYLIKSKPVDNIEAQFSFTCLDSEKKVIATLHAKEMLQFTDAQAWGSKKFVNSTSINKLNSITIVYEVSLRDAKLYNSLLFISPDRIEHFEEFKNLRNNSKFSDVKLTVESKEIFAHKMVLAANSPVFAAMFEHKMKENEENAVSINDISYRVFNELLNFMYTGECTVMKDIASELFEAADKYQLLKLKSMCEEELCRNINVNNVVAYLQLGDRHSAQQLKKGAIDFITLHGKEIIDEPEFESIENPKLLKDIVKSVFSGKN